MYGLKAPLAQVILYSKKMLETKWTVTVRPENIDEQQFYEYT